MTDKTPKNQQNESPTKDQMVMLDALNVLKRHIYEGTADPKKVAKARALRKGKPGSAFRNKAQREWNKFAYGEQHEVNRAKKKQAIEEALTVKEEN